MPLTAPEQQSQALVARVKQQSEELTAIPAEEYLTRLDKLRAVMAEQKRDALLLVAGSNMQYFTGLHWGMTERLVGALVTPQSLIFICPAFEESALRPLLKVPGDFAFWQEHESPSALVAQQLKNQACQQLAVDPKCPLWLFEQLQLAIGHAAPRCVMQSGVALIGNLRAVKSVNELALIQKAMSITLEVQQQAYQFMQAGMRASEVITFIDNTHRKLGADNGSYFCAVQFDEGTAHPHGVPGDPILTDNSLVLIDTGCRVNGYHSDITRTYGFGEQPAEVEELWQLEKEAQATAFDAVRPPVPCQAIDKAARDLLAQRGLGPDYQLPGLPHRTGHGIGLEIHEGPYLVRGDNTPLETGMCFSNEPMIVVPNRFGLRLEDHFFVTPTGAAWFTEPQPSLYQPFHNEPK